MYSVYSMYLDTNKDVLGIVLLMWALLKKKMDLYNGKNVQQNDYFVL